MPLNHRPDYKCAHTYIQIPYNWNCTLSDVSTNNSGDDNLALTVVLDKLCGVLLYNYNLCLAPLVCNYLWEWGCMIHGHIGGCDQCW